LLHSRLPSLFLLYFPKEACRYFSLFSFPWQARAAMTEQQLSVNGVIMDSSMDLMRLIKRECAACILFFFNSGNNFYLFVLCKRPFIIIYYLLFIIYYLFIIIVICLCTYSFHFLFTVLVKHAGVLQAEIVRLETAGKV
jgi:hypothetical protein